MKTKLLLCVPLVLCGGSFTGNCPAAIIYPKAPEGGKQIVARCLDPKTCQTLGITNVENLAIADPCQSYSFDVLSGKRLSAATPGVGGGWRYPLLHGTNAVGVAYLTADEKTGKALKCTELGEDSSLNDELEALQIAEQLPQVKKQDFELRFLNLPWIVFSAVWLHGRSDNIIIPLPDAWKRWNSYQPYSESQIIQILKPELKKEAAMWKKASAPEMRNRSAYCRAMMDYETAHGRKCGAITNYTASIHGAGSPRVYAGILKGKPSKGGILACKAKITFADETLSVVKRVEILEKVADKKP